MILRSLGDLVGTDVVVSGENFVSHRLVLARDKVGVSVHITRTRKGSNRKLEYKNHLEAVYVIGGEAIVHDLAAGRSVAVSAGTCVALDKHDAYRLEAITDLELFCVFNPACVGTEVHDADGSYPLPGESPTPA